MNAPSQPTMPIPMTFGQTLDRIYRLMRAQLKLFLAVASVPAVAMVAMMAIIFAVAFIPILSQLPKQPDPALMAGLMIPSMLLILPLSLAVFALYLAAAIHAAMQANLGLTVTFREAYAVASKRIGRYLWLTILIYIIAFLPILLLELLIFGATGLLSTNNAEPNPALFLLIPLIALLFIGAMVYGVIIAMRLSLAFPAALTEDLPAVAALRRSSQLTQGAKGRIFLILLVIYALGYAAEMVGFMALAAVIGIGALIMAACGVQMPSAAGITGLVLAGLLLCAFLFLLSALLWSAFSTALAVLYHDQRLRKEGILSTPIQPGEPA